MSEATPVTIAPSDTETVPIDGAKLEVEHNQLKEERAAFAALKGS